MDENALLKAISKMMDERDKKLESMIDAKLEPIKAEQAATNKRLDKMQADLDILKEDSTVTRTAVNTLLDWAEEAQVETRIPLYKKEQ